MMLRCSIYKVQCSVSSAHRFKLSLSSVLTQYITFGTVCQVFFSIFLKLFSVVSACFPFGLLASVYFPFRFQISRFARLDFLSISQFSSFVKRFREVFSKLPLGFLRKPRSLERLCSIPHSSPLVNPLFPLFSFFFFCPPALAFLSLFMVYCPYPKSLSGRVAVCQATTFPRRRSSVCLPI